jgi:RNA polymerase sigma-70 factor (ECF subfamily)
MSKPAALGWTDLSAETAVARLLEEHGGQLYRIGLRFCGNEADAEDLVQQTFLQAFRKWHQFNGDAAPTTWLYTIAARACERHRRRRVGEPTRLESLDDLLPSTERKIVDLPADGDSPLDTQLKREAQEAVDRGIGTLPTKLRMSLVLKDIVDLSIQEIALVLGLKPATVKTRVHRARLMLRRELARKLPRKTAPPPDHAKRMCLDLLKAKQDALDNGVAFPVPREEMCERCQSLFATLDLGHETCQRIGRGHLPPVLRKQLLATFAGSN